MYTNRSFTFLTDAFENVGRLSLSNYLLQSVICTTIFYGYGFGLFGSLGVLNAIALGFGIYIMQIIGSSFYLRYFKQGPVEKLLQLGTNLAWSSRSKKKAKIEPSPYTH
ncbi:MAG: DUF418 domain-containing protein [Bacillus sp. (in: firmicutes)]